MTLSRPETFKTIETLVITALVFGDAVINRGEQPPYEIKFAAAVEHQGRNWLTVKATYKGLCCLIDPSHPQKNQEERRGQQRKMGDLLEKLREAGLLENIDDGVHNIPRKAGCYFCLKLNFKDYIGSRIVLWERLGVGTLPISQNPFSRASSASGINDDVKTECHSCLKSNFNDCTGSQRVPRERMGFKGMVPIPQDLFPRASSTFGIRRLQFKNLGVPVAFRPKPTLGPKAPL